MWKEKLKTDQHVLLANEGKLPHPRELTLFKDDTLVIVLPSQTVEIFGSDAARNLNCLRSSQNGRSLRVASGSARRVEQGLTAAIARDRTRSSSRARLAECKPPGEVIAACVFAISPRHNREDASGDHHPISLRNSSNR